MARQSDAVTRPPSGPRRHWCVLGLGAHGAAPSFPRREAASPVGPLLSGARPLSPAPGGHAAGAPNAVPSPPPPGQGEEEVPTLPLGGALSGCLRRSVLPLSLLGAAGVPGSPQECSSGTAAGVWKTTSFLSYWVVWGTQNANTAPNLPRKLSPTISFN